MDYRALRRMSQGEIDNLYEKHIGPILPVVKHKNRFTPRGGVDAGQRRRAIGKLFIEELHSTHLAADCTQYGPCNTGLECDHLLVDVDVPYMTGTGHALSFLVQMFSIYRDNVPMLTDYERVTSCGDCKGTSGSCPGFAPSLSKIHPKYPYLYVIATTLDMTWALEYASHNNWVYMLTWADRLTTSYVRRMMLAFSDYTTFGAGSCAGKCKDCAVLNGNKCAKPDKRRHSMEAVGIDCDMLHHDVYGEYLPWCYHGVQAVPSYMTRYTGVLPRRGQPGGLGDTLLSFCKNDKSFKTYIKKTTSKANGSSFSLPVPSSSLPDFPEYEAVEVEIPSGVHKGCHQYMYNLDARKL